MKQQFENVTGNNLPLFDTSRRPQVANTEVISGIGAVTRGSIHPAVIILPTLYLNPSDGVGARDDLSG